MENKDYLKNIEGAERRFITPNLHLEKREEEEKPAIIEGYAAMFNSRTNLGWFEEEILPGAFDEVLNDDVRALFNHDPNLIVARSNKGEGTLELFVDEKGLGYRFTPPDTTAGRDLQRNIELGLVTQSSFGFSISEQVWVERDGEPDLRQIKKLSRLYDVSPVTYPAYTDTSVAKRSHDAVIEEKTQVTDSVKNSELEARFRLLNLNKR